VAQNFAGLIVRGGGSNAQRHIGLIRKPALNDRSEKNL
jgi:hypothetical protein